MDSDRTKRGLVDDARAFAAAWLNHPPRPDPTCPGCGADPNGQHEAACPTQPRRFTLYRAVIGNAVGQWNVAEGEVPTDVLGYPVETIAVVESA